MPNSLAVKVLDQLADAESKLGGANALVGLDGFVDSILHLVDKRESASDYTRVTRMSVFAERINAAAGLSGNFEFVTQMVKLGGNGPIMANALNSYGMPLTYIGNLGEPTIHPVFESFAKRVKIISLAEPGCTDALEFDDGKLMLGKHSSLAQVNWENLTRKLPEPLLVEMFRNAQLVALVNWTMLLRMDGILENVLAKIAPNLGNRRPWLFFDLADPAKREREDIGKVLKLIAAFQKHFRTILGLNLQESRQIGEVLGIMLPDDSHASVTEHAALIREELAIETVVIHPTSFAAAADANGATHVVGPFTAKPKITTGAGDHFNAGFCIGRLLGLDLAGSLQIGVATSGFYVRQAASPSLGDLRAFLSTL